VAVRRIPAIMGRVLIGVQTLRFAPPPRRGADGLDADSALAFGAAIGDRPGDRRRPDESDVSCCATVWKGDRGGGVSGGLVMILDQVRSAYHAGPRSATGACDLEHGRIDVSPGRRVRPQTPREPWNGRRIVGSNLTRAS
jgi:hypothetical protein